MHAPTSLPPAITPARPANATAPAATAAAAAPEASKQEPEDEPQTVETAEVQVCSCQRPLVKCTFVACSAQLLP